jgi:hypothetical protein
MRRRRALITLLLGMSVGVLTAADTIPFTVATGEVMDRAERWYRLSPTYSQDHCFASETGYADTDWSGVLGGCHWPTYRTDCSGFVSMVWGVRYSYATPRAGLDQDLTDVSRVISRSQLRTGDALLAYGRHVRLFERWTDASRTGYWAYDFGSTPVKHQVYRWGAPGEYHYVPIRFDPTMAARASL